MCRPRVAGSSCKRTQAGQARPGQDEQQRGKRTGQDYRVPPPAPTHAERGHGGAASSVRTAPHRTAEVAAWTGCSSSLIWEMTRS